MTRDNDHVQTATNAGWHYEGVSVGAGAVDAVFSDVMEHFREGFDDRFCRPVDPPKSVFEHGQRVVAGCIGWRFSFGFAA